MSVCELIIPFIYVLGNG